MNGIGGTHAPTGPLQATFQSEALVVKGFTIQGDTAVRNVPVGNTSFTLTVPLNTISPKNREALEKHLAHFTDDFCKKGAEMCLKMELGIQREGKQTIKSISVQVNEQGGVRTITKGYEQKGDLPFTEKEVNLTKYDNKYQPTLNQQPPADDKTKEKIAKWEATLNFMGKLQGLRQGVAAASPGRLQSQPERSPAPEGQNADRPALQPSGQPPQLVGNIPDISPAVANANRTVAPTKAMKYTSTPESPAAIYADKKALRPAAEAIKHRELSAVGGAGTAATEMYNQYGNRPNCKIGVMLAANSGQSGGRVGQDLAQQKTINEDQLNLKVQEESVFANVLMTMCGADVSKQKDFFNKTIEGQWGMETEYDSKNVNNMTKQGHDFTKLEAKGKSAEKYNQAYVVDNCRISDLEGEANGVKIGNNSCPVALIFADSVNANAALGTPQGTMQRTLNPNAVNNYDEFRECVKTKLRAALDASAAAGVTVPLVALLSGGIYAGKHESLIAKDYENILKEVLNEPVGVNGEPRGSFFIEVIIPTLK